MNKNLLFICVIFFVANSAWAQTNVYATLGAGWTIPSLNSSKTADSSFVHFGPTAAPSGESFFNLPNVNWQYKYQNGFNINAAIGYKLSSALRADIEFLYQSFRRKIAGTYGWAEYDALSAAILDSASGIPIVPTSDNTNVYTVLTNGYYDFHNNSKWTPLIGAGFGVAWVKSQSTSANGSFSTPVVTNTPTLQHSPAFTGTAFAWQIKAGTAYEYSKLISIIMQYRLFATSSFIAEPSTIITNPNGGTSRRVFTISRQIMRGLFTNSLEIQLGFNLAG